MGRCGGGAGLSDRAPGEGPEVRSEKSERERLIFRLRGLSGLEAAGSHRRAVAGLLAGLGAHPGASRTGGRAFGI